MQVSVESMGGLKRRMSVSVPESRVDTDIHKRINEIAKTIKMDGFRPGKVPVAVVKKRYDGAIRQEVLSDIVRNTFDEAIAQQGLRLAGMPNITDANMVTAPGQPFEYHAEFEVFPEFAVEDLSNESITRYVATVAADDVDEAITRARESQATWHKVEREARLKDRVTINYVGTMDGEAFVGGTADNVPLILGSNTMIPGFEDGLLGAKIDEKRVLDLAFPTDYSHAEYAGKAAQFTVTVIAIEEPGLPELNEEFFKQFSLKDATLAGLQARVQQDLEADLKELLINKVKTQVFDKLLARHTFDLPTPLVQEETRRLKHAAVEQFMGGRKVDQELLDRLPDDIYKPQAEKNVKLGLILSELIKKYAITLDTKRFQDKIQEMAKAYGDPKQFIAFYEQNPQAKNTLQNLVLEDQIVDKLLESVMMQDQSVSYKELREQV